MPNLISNIPASKSGVNAPEQHGKFLEVVKGLFDASPGNDFLTDLTIATDAGNASATTQNDTPGSDNAENNTDAFVFNDQNINIQADNALSDMMDLLALYTEPENLFGGPTAPGDNTDVPPENGDGFPNGERPDEAPSMLDFL